MEKESGARETRRVREAGTPERSGGVAASRRAAVVVILFSA